MSLRLLPDEHELPDGGTLRTLCLLVASLYDQRGKSWSGAVPRVPEREPVHLPCGTRHSPIDLGAVAVHDPECRLSEQVGAPLALPTDSIFCNGRRTTRGRFLERSSLDGRTPLLGKEGTVVLPEAPSHSTDPIRRR